MRLKYVFGAPIQNVQNFYEYQRRISAFKGIVSSFRHSWRFRPHPDVVESPPCSMGLSREL